MKKEGTIGAAAFLAIAAVVGVSLQSGPKQGPSGRTAQGAPLKRPAQPSKNSQHAELGPGCQSIDEQFKEFLNVWDAKVDKDAEPLIVPEECYAPNPAAAKKIPKEIIDKTSKLKFVIATLPDPLHTHQAVLFDQFTVAIQEAAQDEKYDFDGSWLPWEDEPETYALLTDQERADLRNELREQQPGIFLFRSPPGPKSYGEGLVVFVVGEEATHGIHKDQFRNALAWFDALVPGKDKRKNRLAILGPTFSGSLPSLTQVFSDQRAAEDMSLHSSENPLDIYSGSVSSNSAAKTFSENNSSKVNFHSFVQNDDAILDRFCEYMNWEQQSPSDIEKFAILSEDETAYGKSGVKEKEKPPEEHQPAKPACPESAVKLFYPRDISALRGAYQMKSIFDVGTGAPPPDALRRSLPTDLADPAGKVHDSIRSYGSNQTPLVQEAFLLEIVAALRDLHARYILLRGSNTLDQLFLANFLRRMYPGGRIVILSSDLLFIRERGATGLNGTMTLTNYPLFPLTRDWTEHQSLPAADRVFSSDTSEGTYIAFRVLLNSKSLSGGTADMDRCHVAGEGSNRIFVPEVVCNSDPPIPDYSPPYWVVPDDCSEAQAKSPGCNYSGPATWLTVIGVNRFWPIASLTKSRKEQKREQEEAQEKEQEKEQEATKSLSAVADAQKRAKASDAPLRPPDAGTSENQSSEPGRRLEFPPGMKLFFAILVVFSGFHAWWCWHGSYTAKPNFLAHFASIGDWRHTVLIFSGSCLLAFIGIVAAWGCGAFFFPAFPLPASHFVSPWFALSCALIVCLIAWASTIGRIATVWRLAAPRSKKWMKDFFHRNWRENRRSSVIFLAVLAFFGLHVLVAERLLGKTDRALTYWRAMHLSSGVSAIVPLISLLVGLYIWFWLALHGLALFGPDRPRFPLLQDLKLKIKNSEQQEEECDYLRMFSQEVAASKIEETGMPFSQKTAVVAAAFFVLSLFAIWVLSDGASLRGLGTQCNVLILMIWLVVCISLQLTEAWRLHELWEELRGLLSFLDRLPLRRTFAVMRGISWDNVWKMGGNVLEVRYKVISRQLESMNHSISSLADIKNSKDAAEVRAAKDCLKDLEAMRMAGTNFANWYCPAYTNPDAGDLTAFKTFQESVAKATGTLLTHLLIPVWRKETHSLILAPPMDKSAVEKEASAPSVPPPAEEEYVRNAEEFVCLTYLGFIQNIIGRLRTLAMTVVALFFATTIALSTYPFDPRQFLSAILIALFAILGIVIVKVYAEMHRDATLSHITNTKPGELGTEFWFKVLAFGFAPLVGLLTRIFPGISDFIFSWIQPSISSLK